MSLFADLGTSIATFWHESVTPFLRNLLSNAVHAEVVSLQPIVEKAFAAEQENIVKAAVAGSLSGLAASSAAILIASATEAETVGVTAGIQSLLTTVAGAIANHPSVVAATPTPTVDPVGNTDESDGA